MTKEEFRGFDPGAQKDMILESLVRVIGDMDVAKNNSGKPYSGTVKQRQNDLKLMTILADAFVKDELVWKWPVNGDPAKDLTDTRQKLDSMHIGVSGSKRMSMAEFISERFNKKY